jgi:hypothetical protein
MQPQMRGLIRKSVIFFENIDFNHRRYFAYATPPAMTEFGRFGILADGRPIRLGGRAFDVLMALIEASGAVVPRTRSRAASGKAGSSIRNGSRAQDLRLAAQIAMCVSAAAQSTQAAGRRPSCPTQRRRAVRGEQYGGLCH